MTFMDHVWEFLDNAWFLLTVAAVLAVFAAAVVVPVELAVLIYRAEQMQVAIESQRNCDCQPMKFPHVLPRFRDQ